MEWGKVYTSQCRQARRRCQDAALIFMQSCRKREVEVLRVSGEPVSVKELTSGRTVMALLRHLG